MEQRIGDGWRIFDLHCDTLSECAQRQCGLENDQLHFSLSRIPEQVSLCQTAAVFIPDTLRGQAAVDYFDQIYTLFVEQCSLHRNLAVQVASASQVAVALEQNRVALLLAVEGGAVLAGDVSRLDDLWRRGVRMMTLTWNGQNEICGGCSTDLGFTPFGRQVVSRMEQLGMAVDVSHLSDRGFYQLCEFAEKPFLATHSNARAVCDHRRNLTDEMFGEIVRRGGVVGLNFYPPFVVAEGESADIGDLFRHIDHFLGLGGEDTLAIGSDFDGADMPCYLNGVEKLDFLAEYLSQAGLSDIVIRKILFDNAYRYLSNIVGGN